MTDSNQFANISSINPLDESSWRNKIFLTIDLDWAHDDVIRDTFDLIKASKG